ncbi:MAG: hypothetical protein HY329_21800, partial [Chloroflexi bacterium]|nr:hypothetical protein [Chloroflexota bacterium]
MSVEPANFTSARFDLNDWSEWLELAYERRWTDGLPVVPPTPARVAEIVAYLGRDPQESLGLIPPKLGNATIEKI